MRMRWLMAGGLVLATGCGGGSNGGGGTTNETVSYRAVEAAVDFPADPFALATAVETGDVRSVREHAWHVWAAITAPSGEVWNGQELPLFETWFSSEELYARHPYACTATAPRPLQRGFESPAQHLHAHGLGNGGTQLDEAVTSMNRFSAEVAEHVCAQRYYLAKTLTALNADFDSATPLAARSIEEFPERAVATKPVYWIVKHDAPTVLPYWAGSGPQATSDAQNPTPQTWKQCVLVVPPGVDAPAAPHRVTCNGTADTPAELVDLDRFYHFRLSAAEAKLIGDNADLLGDAPVPGDYAALVAMHVTTKELPRWTWQTFWWTPHPDASPDGDFRTDDVRDAFRSYAMCTAYRMLDGSDADAPPVVCFNPYLETGLTDVQGTASNCMTCHRLAAWPNFSTPYVASGEIGDGDPRYFSDDLKLDFLWSVTRAVR